MEEIHSISRYGSLSRFVYSDPNISTLVYNSQNALLEYMLETTYNFMNSINDVYVSQLSETKAVVIVLICLCALFMAVQIPIGYSLDTAISAEIDIFLQLPSRVCGTLEKQANDFVARLQVLPLP